MNTKSRLIIIVFFIIASLILVWPNIGTRTIEVGFLPEITEEERAQAMDDLSNYLNEVYPGKYSAEASAEKPEMFLIRGNFIQAAFLNDLSRLNHVDPENIKVQPLWVEQKLKARPFKLGLDLQGGMNLLLEADFEKLQKQIDARFPAEYVANLHTRISQAVDEDEKANLEFELEQIEDSRNFTPEKKREYVSGALEIIRSRIDKTGVSDPLIRIQGNDKIEISLPGVASPQAAKKLISSTARVEYHLSEPAGSGGVGQYTQLAFPYFSEYAALESDAQRENLIKKIEKEIKLPYNLGLYVYWDRNPTDERRKLVPQRFMVLEREIALSGDAITPNTYVGFDSERLQQTVNFSLTPEGTKKFGEVTTANRGRQLAILIDDKIRSAPTINDPILTGSAMIHGSFTQQEAKDLALIIKEGALPVPMMIVEERSVGPSLGYESISKGVKAITLGLILVAIFMVIYYHAAGVVAVIALVLNLLFMSAILALMDFTITLPGLAGVVLTLGMIVDANVIIYERIREEIARGKSFRLAITQGFDRATWTILDSNLTTMLAAIVLSNFGVGPIKGFAVTLFIGILTSLFTSLYATKTLFYSITYDLNVRSFSLGWSKRPKNTEASA